ncbi:MAG: ADP-ribosylglycohydrolase [Frankiales bacterium]|nr:ADP-ribosylglycohydrolase [Frankiales bacterium]
MTQPFTSQDRVEGCLLAGAVGDALGAAVEFLSLDQIRAAHGPQGVTGYAEAYGGLGRVTDDSQMSILTVEGIRRALATGQPVNETTYPLYRDWAHAQVAGRWADHADPWLVEQPVLLAQRAPGHACLSGLTRGWMPTLDNRVNTKSKGSGTVMRSATYGLVPSWSPEEAFGRAVEGAASSHGHDTALVAAGALAMIVRHLLDGVALLDAVDQTLQYLDGYEGLDTFEATEAIAQALDASVLMEPTPEAVEALGGGWTAEEALAIAVFCALTHEHDIEAALLLASNHGGDSDSTASICGNLVGAVHGLVGMPEEWILGNEVTAFVSDLSLRLVASQVT